METKVIVCIVLFFVGMIMACNESDVMLINAVGALLMVFSGLFLVEKTKEVRK